MKLKLEKQKVTTLSSKDMSQVNGGGLARSVRKDGQCNYSNNVRASDWGYDLEGNYGVIGCHQKSVAG